MKLARPGDGGPCPICGEDMAAKEYPNESIIKKLRELRPTVRGRYWHMRNEHGTLESYSLNHILEADEQMTDYE